MSKSAPWKLSPIILTASNYINYLNYKDDSRSNLRSRAFSSPYRARKLK